MNKKTFNSLIKEDVRFRDENMCRGCSAPKEVNRFRVGGVNSSTYREVNLDVHHRNNPLDHSLDNLVTVCRICHRYLHKLKNFRPEEYQRILGEMDAGSFPLPPSYCDKCYQKLPT